MTFQNNFTHANISKEIIGGLAKRHRAGSLPSYLAGLQTCHALRVVRPPHFPFRFGLFAAIPGRKVGYK